MPPESLEARLFSAYREFFSAAERHRRWNVEDDIPWDRARSGLHEDLVCVIETFWAVELFLPDYVSKILDLARASRGRAWFQANWGYEESKHSLVLEQWLVRSGARTPEELEALASRCFENAWPLAYDQPRKMLAYQMVQELATAVNYRHLREAVAEHGDPSLDAALRLVMIDERAHYQFFRDAFALFVEEDEAAATRDLYEVLGEFRMPSQRAIPHYAERGATIERAGIFGPKTFVREVSFPIYKALEIEPRFRALEAR